MTRKKVLIGVSASVAAIKLPELIDCIQELCQRAALPWEIEVKIVITRNSGFFVDSKARLQLKEIFLRSMNPTLLEKYDDEGITPTFFGQGIDDVKLLGDGTLSTGKGRVNDRFLLSGFYTDEDELHFWEERGKVLHIMLKSWADVYLFAPLDANSLSKIANGMADNLVTCVARAWPVGRKPMLFATAMNSDMFNHPLTRMHLEVMEETLLAQHIEPVEKQLACGEFGIGAMASVNTIAACLEKALEESCD